MDIVVSLVQELGMHKLFMTVAKLSTSKGIGAIQCCNVLTCLSLLSGSCPVVLATQGTGQSTCAAARLWKLQTLCSVKCILKLPGEMQVCALIGVFAACRAGGCAT